MPLLNEQIKELKSQLKEQLSHLPPDKKAEAEKQIESLSPEALEEMLSQQQSKKAIFRMIVDNEVESVRIDENSQAIAVLELNPISKGHAIIIPKSPVKEESQLLKEVNSLSEKISKKLIENLKAKSTQVFIEKKFGEVIIDIIPIYDKPLSQNSPRQKSSVEELQKLKTSINVEKIEKKKEIIKKEKKEQKLIKLKRRVP